MLSDFLVNILDIINIIYLWAVISKKNSEVYRLLISVVIGSVFIAIINFLELNFIVSYIVFIMVIKIAYKRQLKSVILEFFFILFIEMSLQVVINAIMSEFIYDDYTKMITIELITLVMIIIFSKLNLRNNISFERINNNIIMYLIFTFSMNVIIFKIIWIYNDTIILNNLLITAVIVIIMASSQLLTYIYIIKGIKENEKLKVSKEYNEVIEEIVQEIKQRQHDFSNYKNTIRGIVEVVDEKNIRDTIRNYIKDEDVYDNEINNLIYINNVVIRSIIYRSICNAKKYNVNFQYKIDNNVLDNVFNYNEISNLLNNLINNAFEEVQKDECIKKNIEVKVINKNKTSHLIIKNQIANSNNININEMFRRGYSTKNTDTRGYGLYNVEQIITSHKGCMEIKVESEEIMFNIYFNNSSG